MQNLADQSMAEVLELKEQLEAVQEKLDEAIADQEDYKNDVSEQSVTREKLQVRPGA